MVFFSQLDSALRESAEDHRGWGMGAGSLGLLNANFDVADVLAEIGKKIERKKRRGRGRLVEKHSK